MMILAPIAYLDSRTSHRSSDPLGLEVVCLPVVRFEVGDGSPHVLHLEFPAIHLGQMPPIQERIENRFLRNVLFHSAICFCDF